MLKASTRIVQTVSRTTSLTVKPSSVIVDYRDLSSENLKRIGNELGVRNLLFGSFEVTSDELTFELHLVDVVRNYFFWTKTFKGPKEDLQSIPLDVAASIASTLDPNPASLTQGPESSKFIDITAYDLVLRARSLIRHFSGEQDNEEIKMLLHKAIAIEKDYAPAYAQLSAALYKKARYGAVDRIWKDSALNCVNKALELDPNLPRALFIKSIIFDDPRVGRSEEAILLREKAIKLNPSSSADISLLGWKLFWNTDSTEKATELIIRALTLDYALRDPNFYCNLASVYQTTFDYENALHHCQQALMLNPNHSKALKKINLLLYYLDDYEQALPLAAWRWHNADPTNYEPLVYLGLYYTKLESWTDAELVYQKMAELEKHRENDNNWKETYLPWRHRLAFVFKNQGKTHVARKIVREDLELINSRISETSTGYDFYHLAAVHAFLGNSEDVLSALELSIKDYPFIPSYELLMADPLFIPYHESPGFKETVKKFHQLKYNPETHLKRSSLRKAILKFETYVKSYDPYSEVITSQVGSEIGGSNQ